MKKRAVKLVNYVKTSLVVITVTLGAVNGAVAGPILSATSATINSGGPGFGAINDTFNQNGLSAGYVSGVTDFDTYIGTTPSHTSTFSGFEWFSNSGTTSARVTYNLGAAQTIDALALWNEEAAGIGMLDLHSSIDGINFSVLSLGLLPTNNSLSPDSDTDTPYFADVFTFSAVNAQYIRFDMSNCSQQPATFNSCSIGEVAFRQGQVSNNVPEPSALSLAILGFAGMAFSKRRFKV